MFLNLIPLDNPISINQKVDQLTYEAYEIRHNLHTEEHNLLLDQFKNSPFHPSVVQEYGISCFPVMSFYVCFPESQKGVEANI